MRTGERAGAGVTPDRAARALKPHYTAPEATAATASSTIVQIAAFWSMTTRWGGEKPSRYWPPNWSAQSLLMAAGTIGSSEPCTKYAGTSQRLTMSLGSNDRRTSSPASAEARRVAPDTRVRQAL